MTRFALTVLAVFAAALPVMAQNTGTATQSGTTTTRRATFGPELGFFFPTSDRTRSAFGKTWVNYGVGFRPIALAKRKGVAGFDLNIISTRGGGRSATLIPASVIYKRAIGGGEPGMGATPYVGGTAGLLIADLRSDNYGVSSGFRGGYGGSALIGITYQSRAYVEARYQLFNKVKGFDLSGINVSTGYRF